MLDDYLKSMPFLNLIDHNHNSKIDGWQYISLGYQFSSCVVKVGPIGSHNPENILVTVFNMPGLLICKWMTIRCIHIICFTTVIFFLFISSEIWHCTKQPALLFLVFLWLFINSLHLQGRWTVSDLTALFPLQLETSSKPIKLVLPEVLAICIIFHVSGFYTSWF